jgi:hypothetical protein
MNLYNHIVHSGLYKIISKIKCNVLSETNEEPFTFFTQLRDNKIEIVNISNELHSYETCTLNKLHDDALIEDFYVLYIHTKGCRYNNNNNIYVNDWVEYLIFIHLTFYVR